MAEETRTIISPHRVLQIKSVMEPQKTKMQALILRQDSCCNTRPGKFFNLPSQVQVFAILAADTRPCDAGCRGQPSDQLLRMPTGHSSQDRLAFAALARQQETEQPQQQHSSTGAVLVQQHPLQLPCRLDQQQQLYASDREQQQQKGLFMDVSGAHETQADGLAAEPRPAPDQHAFLAHHANDGGSHNARLASSSQQQQQHGAAGDISGVLKTQQESQSAQAAAEATAQAACRDYLALLHASNEQQQLQHPADASPTPALRPAARGTSASGIQNPPGES